MCEVCGQAEGTLEKMCPGPPKTFTEFPRNGLLCPVCHQQGMKEPLRITDTGTVCKYGHGGVRGISEKDTALEKIDNPETPLFENANGPELDSGLHAGFVGIIETMRVDDVLGTYKTLCTKLKCGQAIRDDKGRLREALDEAEDNARLAHLLWSNALVEQARFEYDAATTFGNMWTQAVESLESTANEPYDEEEPKGRKRAKVRKSITNEDVKAKCAEMFPPQWRSHHIGEVKVKAMVAHMKELSDQWSQRCRSLEVLLNTCR